MTGRRSVSCGRRSTPAARPTATARARSSRPSATPMIRSTAPMTAGGDLAAGRGGGAHGGVPRAPRGGCGRGERVPVHHDLGHGGPYDGSDGEVWRYSIDDGTWTDLTPDYRPVGSDFGFSGLSIDADDPPDTIMVTTQVQWWPDILIFRSTDGGESWSPPIWEYASDEEGEPGARHPLPAGHLRGAVADLRRRATEPTLWTEPAPKLGWMAESLSINPLRSRRDDVWDGCDDLPHPEPHRLGRGRHRADHAGSPGGHRGDRHPGSRGPGGRCGPALGDVRPGRLRPRLHRRGPPR